METGDCDDGAHRPSSEFDGTAERNDCSVDVEGQCGPNGDSF